MYEIWKYKLVVSDTQFIDMPINSKVLSIQSQNNIITMWVMVDPEAKMAKRLFHVFGTGHEVRIEYPEDKYIGTILMAPNGYNLVWHIFDGGYKGWSKE